MLFSFVVGAIVGYVFFTIANELGLIKIAQEYLRTAKEWNDASEKLHIASVRQSDAAKAYHDEALIYRDTMKKYDEDSKAFLEKAIASYDESQVFLNNVKRIDKPSTLS
jgi:type I restriction-modification system DNA methylase subunit